MFRNAPFSPTNGETILTVLSSCAKLPVKRGFVVQYRGVGAAAQRDFWLFPFCLVGQRQKERLRGKDTQRMRIERLRLTDFRNYPQLDLTLPPGLVIFSGRNAQGKSNLLEAVTLIATSRSFRTSSEREAVRWGAPGHFARVEATVVRASDTLHVEVILTENAQDGAPGGSVGSGAIADKPGAPPGASPARLAAPEGAVRKRIRVNGAPRRAMDLLGLAPVVVFAPTDLDLVIGSPSDRRRFLDLTLCQVDQTYCRALSQYQKVLTQRAALLRRIRDGQDTPQALAYWDDLLARLAAPIMRTRASFIERAELAAARVYATLSHDTSDAGGDDLDDLDDIVGADADADETRAMDAPDDALTVTDSHSQATPGALQGSALPGGVDALRLVYHPSYQGPLDGEESVVVAGIRARLAELRRREIAQGMNVMGPHRDDLAFVAGGVDLATYGSRGQQRTVALALKLAELEYIETELGDQPILLLDDVLSELDAGRRADLLAATSGLDQVLLTTTDATSLPPAALAQATRFRVRGGRVSKG